MSAPKKTTRRPRQGTSSAASSRSATIGRVLLGMAVVVVVSGIGLLKWAETRHGQAALLALGSDKMYGEVQSTVEAALRTVLPNLPTGPVAPPAVDHQKAGDDRDWPAPQLGPGAAIRCRRVAVARDITWWKLQQGISRALAKVGARVLWGQRLYPGSPGLDQINPNEDKDLLRLDVGVPGRPTHTLVLYRQDERAVISWGGGQALTRWETLAEGHQPTIALVVDDWGNTPTAPMDEILNLDVPLTMSVLPGRPFSRHFALMATDLILPRDERPSPPKTGGASGSEATRQRLAAGCPVEVDVGRRRRTLQHRRREIILHLPMEPLDFPQKDPGPGALMVGMKGPEIEALLDQDLLGLPSVAGVNNHMGSAATSDTETMVALMRVLKKHGLYFLDSLTTSGSVAYREARSAGLPALRNRTFLDYDQENPEHIKANLEVLATAARSSGFAVGIGHPHAHTAKVLAREIPRLQREGFRFVTLGEMLALKRVAQEQAQSKNP